MTPLIIILIVISVFGPFNFERGVEKRNCLLICLAGFYSIKISHAYYIEEYKKDILKEGNLIFENLKNIDSDEDLEKFIKNGHWSLQVFFYYIFLVKLLLQHLLRCLKVLLFFLINNKLVKKQ